MTSLLGGLLSLVWLVNHASKFLVNSSNCVNYMNLNCYEWLDENDEKRQTCQYEHQKIDVFNCESDCDAHFGSKCVSTFVISQGIREIFYGSKSTVRCLL